MKPHADHEAFAALQEAFESFRVRSEYLEQAYSSMAQQFERLNLELDDKNRCLEEALAEQERMHTVLGSILDTMHNGVVAVDIQGNITQFNASAERITGYGESDAMGADFNLFFGAKGLSENNVMDVLSSGKGYDRNEKNMWHSSGEPVSVVYQSALLRDPQGILLGAVEIFSDISRLKQLETENQQNRILAALGEMAATLAHEIKNPLGAMATWARLLDRSFDREDKRKQTCGKIIDALSRLNKIVSSMLIFGRQSNKTELRVLDIKFLLNEFVDSMEVEVIFSSGASIGLTKDWDEIPLLVPVDPEKLRQILLNVALNAVQAIGEQDGHLTVSCRSHQKEGGKYAIISVADTGMGIPSEELERIFTPFHTSKEDGTGLGLAIVRKLVDFHNGVIDVESTVGEGTKMHIFLPLAELNKYSPR